MRLIASFLSISAVLASNASCGSMGFEQVVLSRREPAAVASSAKRYGANEVFINNRNIYSDLKKTKIQGVTTSQLSAIELVSVDQTSAGVKYLHVTADLKNRGRSHVYIHVSGVRPEIQTLMAAVPSKPDSTLPWGDPLLTEAYNKNRAVREAWFESVKHLFDLSSDLAKQIVAGVAQPPELSETVAGSYLVHAEGAIFVRDENGTPLGQTIPAGSLVTVAFTKKHRFDSQAKSYRHSLSPIVKFETAAAFWGEAKITGYLSITDLDSATEPVKDLSKVKENYERLIPVLEARYRAEDGNLTIARALRQFHSSICTAAGPGKQELFLKWDAFIRSKSNPRAKQVAENAFHVDISARTILGEAQTDALLWDPEKIQSLEHKVFHKEASRCQRDLLALSIRNRVFTTKYGEFRHKRIGDFAGAASDPAQYNVWKHTADANYRLTSCFLHTAESYQKARESKDSQYKRKRAYFTDMTERYPGVFGMDLDEGAPPTSDPAYLGRLFSADPYASLTEAERIAKIARFMHYYHPNNKGLQYSDASEMIDNVRYGTVENGYVRVIHIDAGGRAEADYHMVTGGVVNQFDKEGVPKRLTIRINKDNNGAVALLDDAWVHSLASVRAYDFEIFVNDRWVEGSQAFRKEGDVKTVVQVLEYGLQGSAPDAANSVRVYLPNALFPQCFENAGHIAGSAIDNSVRVPLSWMSKNVRNDAAESFARLLSGSNPVLHNFMGLPYIAVDKPYVKIKGKKVRLYTDHGQPVQIRCIDERLKTAPTAEQPKEFPEFGGYCDPNIMMVEGASGV